MQPTIVHENPAEDELITKSYNGGYCSKETLKVLEGTGFGNVAKAERRRSSILEIFSNKFSRAFNKAFYTDKQSDKTNEFGARMPANQTNSNLANSNLANGNRINRINAHHPVLTRASAESKASMAESMERTSNFIEKIKSIETRNQLKKQNKSIENAIETVDSSTASVNQAKPVTKKNSNSNKLTGKLSGGEPVNPVSLERRSSDKAIFEKSSLTKIISKSMDKQQQEKKGFELNLDEYCIIKKPELTPKKFSIEEERKKSAVAVKKRNSINRKNITAPASNNKMLKPPHRSHHRASQPTKPTSAKELIASEIAKAEQHHVTAELIEINKDGTQVIELTRVPNHSFGFFVARGKVKNVNGEFYEMVYEMVYPRRSFIHEAR